MKKFLILLAFMPTLYLLGFPSVIKAQNTISNPSENILFVEAEPFCEGLAAVKLDKKWGFINTNGEIVIPFEYDEIQNFKNNFAAVKKSNKWGFINKKGQLVIPFKYQDANSFYEGLAAVKLDNKWGYINSLGNTVIYHKYMSDEYDLAKNHYFKNGFAIEKTDKNFWTIVDKQGNESKLDGWCEHDSEGLFLYIHNKKYGFVNNKGKEVITPKYDYASPFVSGYSVVQLNRKYGIIDKAGNVIVPIKYDYGVCDVYPGDKARMRLNGKAGLIDLKENTILPFIYNYIYLDKRGSTDLIAVQSTETFKWGYVNNKNQTVIPFKYQKVDYFVDGYAIVTLDDKDGVIDKSGKTIIPLIYDEIGSYKIEGPFSSGYCLVKLDKHYGYVDMFNKTLKIKLSGKEWYNLYREKYSDYLLINSAEVGYPLACTKLGYRYIQDKKIAEAVKWLEKSIINGGEENGNDCLYLAWCYDVGGSGLEKDANKALFYLHKGEQKKNTSCYRNLADIYLKGKLGCTVDYNKAVKYAELMFQNYLKNEVLYISSIALYVDCYNFAGGAFMNKNEFNKAEEYFDKAINTVSSIEKDIISPKGVGKHSLYDYENNINIFYHILANVIDTKGELYIKMGKVDEALQLWKKILKIDSENLDYYKKNSILYARLKEIGKI